MSDAALAVPRRALRKGKVGLPFRVGVQACSIGFVIGQRGQGDQTPGLGIAALMRFRE
jgi:hypothetical protein